MLRCAGLESQSKRHSWRGGRTHEGCEVQPSGSTLAMRRLRLREMVEGRLRKSLLDSITGWEAVVKTKLDCSQRPTVLWQEAISLKSTSKKKRNYDYLWKSLTIRVIKHTKELHRKAAKSQSLETVKTCAKSS